MRLALQATFDDLDGTTDESRRRRARCERELEQNRRSGAFYRKLRSVVDDPNVKAPEVFARESFPDPNVVAEYLDYRSESEEVAAEYERVCWDSPEALAEVGDCYDILVNDLPKPIVAPKNCRRRLYYVAWEDAAQPNGNEAAARDLKQDAPMTDESPLDASNADFENEKTPKSSVKKEEKRKSKKAIKSATEPPKYESDVQRTMRKERSVKRRLRGYAVNAVTLLCVLSFGVWALNKARNERRSETFQLATEQTNETNLQENTVPNVADSTIAKPTVARSNYFDEQGRSGADFERNEFPRVADLRGENDAELDADARSESTPIWNERTEALGESNNDFLAITHVDETPTDASIPGVSVTSGFADYDSNLGSSSDVSETTDPQLSKRKQERAGLHRGLNGTRGRSVEIPPQNNDVFAPSQRY